MNSPPHQYPAGADAASVAEPDVNHVAPLTRVEQLALINILEAHHEEIPREQVRNLLHDYSFALAGRTMLEEYQGACDFMAATSVRRTPSK
jgi:hypothetical protein